jgi:hypothetical protein
MHLCWPGNGTITGRVLIVSLYLRDSAYPLSNPLPKKVLCALLQRFDVVLHSSLN